MYGLNQKHFPIINNLLSLFLDTFKSQWTVKVSSYFINTLHSISSLGFGGQEGQAEPVEQQQALRVLVPLRKSSAGSAQATGNNKCESRAPAPDQLISG